MLGLNELLSWLNSQTTECDDVGGYILESIRKLTGEDAVISASADMHANVTEKMLRNADYICGFHTYPHVDYYETGARAAALGVGKLRKSESLRIIRAAIPMIIPANGYTTLQGPYKELMDYGESLVDKGILRDFSIFMMQPWLDVEEGATTVITVAGDKSTAVFHAKDIAEKLYRMRNLLKPDILSIKEVIDKAKNNKSDKPVILVDCADSSNAGAAGDSAAVIEELIKSGCRLKTAAVLRDAPAVERAFSVGVGNVAKFSLGGKYDPVHNKSITVEAYVKSVHDGIFYQEGPAGKGMKINIGRTAVLKIDETDLVVCHNVAGNGDPQLYRAFGIEPRNYRLVVVKACTSFRASYQKFAEEICIADTPGAASSNLMSLDFKKLPRSFYPFSPLDDYVVDDIIEGRNGR